MAAAWASAAKTRNVPWKFPKGARSGRGSPSNPPISEMIPGSVLISDAVFLELVDALNQYSDEEEESHNDPSDGKQDDGKEDLPVTRKRKRHALEGAPLDRPLDTMDTMDTMGLAGAPLATFSGPPGRKT